MKELSRVPNNKVIGYPMTPAFWNQKEPTFTDIMDLTMTAGGGIGGSLWHVYIEPMELPTDSLVKVKTIDGSTLTINTRYVVEAENTVLVEAMYVSNNPYFPRGLYRLWLLSDDRNVVLGNCYANSDLGRGEYIG